MTDRDWFETEEYRSLRRLTLRMCGLGLALAYPVVFVRMRQSSVPAHNTWLGAVFVPLVVFGMLISLLVVPSWFPRTPWLAALVSLSMCIGVAFLIL